MRLVIISDTHNLHRNYGREPFGNIPEGDVLIHCGDITTHGTKQEVDTFLDWFSIQPCRYKIWIAGNHDRCLDGAEDCQCAGIIYLKESGVSINGIYFWGSPYTPDHCDFAFQLRGKASERWAKIPNDVDVLITHGPAFGILDSGHGIDNAGCPALAEAIERIKPKIHAFGHIHEGYGQSFNGHTLSVNAAVHTWLWKQEIRKQPHVVEV